MTKRDFFVAVAERQNITDEMVELATKYIDQLDNRNANRKPSAKQVENEVLKADILNVMSTQGMTVTEILNSLDKDGLTNQRVSALVNKLVADGKAVKTVEKRKSYFSIA